MWSACSYKERQNLETSTGLLTPDIYCALFFRDKVKSTNVTHTRWCKTNGDKKKKCNFLYTRYKKRWKVEFSESTSFPGLPLKKKTQQGPTTQKRLKKKKIHTLMRKQGRLENSKQTRKQNKHFPRLGGPGHCTPDKRRRNKH